MLLGINLAGPEGLIIVGILLTVIFPVWAIVDILKRPDWAWERSGHNRFTWLILMIVGVFVCNVAFFVSLWYLLFVRSDVRNQQEVGRGLGFPNR